MTRRWDRRSLDQASKALPLFDQAGAPTQVGTETSASTATAEPAPCPGTSRRGTREASRSAAAIVGPRLPALESRVFLYIVSRGEHGATDEEIAAHVEGRADTVRCRRIGLRNAGFILDSGRKRTTTAGVLATVWITNACKPYVARQSSSRRFQ
ncbi:MAG: hypothetical protein ACYC35_28300 [Pirellulales bacterium]